MSSWRIPPVGWCAVCLALPDNQGHGYRERAALTLWRGSALCREHLLEVVNDPGVFAGDQMLRSKT